MHLTDRIALVGSSRFGLSNPYDCSVYAVDCQAPADGVLLIDAGSGLEPERIAANMQADGFDPDAVTVVVLTHTHADHAGGARWWRERTGCKIVAPVAERDVMEGAVDVSEVIDVAKRAGIYPADYVFATLPVDRAVDDGDELTYGNIRLRALRVAGHTPGHTCYLTDLDGQRVLFAGDAVLYAGSLLLQNVAGCDLADYRRDIDKLAGLAVDVLLPGHGVFVLRHGQEHLDRAVEALHGLAMPSNFASMCPKIIPRPYREGRL